MIKVPTPCLQSHSIGRLERSPTIWDILYWTMMLLMGIWINLTKKPMNPMIENPIAVAIAIFWNSLRSGFVHLFTRRKESLANSLAGSSAAVIWSIDVTLSRVDSVGVIVLIQYLKYVRGLLIIKYLVFSRLDYLKFYLG